MGEYQAREKNQKETITSDDMKGAVGFANGGRKLERVSIGGLRFDANGKAIVKPWWVK